MAQAPPKLTPTTVRARKRRLEAQIEECHAQLKALRDRCSHRGAIEYCPDPSGNNDSSYDCAACGASWRRWPPDVPQD